jgi:hypothetical protein
VQQKSATSTSTKAAKKKNEKDLSNCFEGKDGALKGATTKKKWKSEFFLLDNKD